MGEVYAARDRLLNRQVAIKVLKEPYARDPRFVARFRQEALAAASLEHPGVVEIYDAPREGELPCIVMEYVEGGTLRDLILRRGRLEWREAASIAAGIARALDAAHSQGVVHRDVKPQNVLLTPSGEPKLADFGIARAADATRVTAPGTILGSVYYISPEQALGEQTGPKSDLYSLGVTLYEMLTGEVPFEAENPIAVAMMHVREHIAPPSSKNPSVPRGLDLILGRLLSKDPAGRHPDAGALAADLEDLIASGGRRAGRRHRILAGGAPVSRRRHGAPGHPGRRGLRNGAAAILTLVALVACAGWWILEGSSRGGATGSIRAAAEPSAPSIAPIRSSAGEHRSGGKTGRRSVPPMAEAATRSSFGAPTAAPTSQSGGESLSTSAASPPQGASATTQPAADALQRQPSSAARQSSAPGSPASGDTPGSASGAPGPASSSRATPTPSRPPHIQLPDLPDVKKIIRESGASQRSNTVSSRQSQSVTELSSQGSPAGGTTAP